MSCIDISIVVPVYNSEKYLRECIHSLLVQSKKEIEIILVDDGSTDSSGNMCDEYGERYSNVHVIHQRNQGQSVARNNGVKLARGEYILYVDSDDTILEQTCEVLYSAAVRYQCDIVRGDMLSHKRITDKDDQTVSAIEYLVSSIQNSYYDIVTVLDLVKKEVLLNRNIHFLENCFYEDQEYMLKLLLDDKTTITKIRFPFYFYRPNPQSTTHVHTWKKGSDFIKILSRMQSDIASRPDLAGYSEYAGTVLAYAVWHYKEVWLHLSPKDRTELHKEFLNVLQKKYLFLNKLSPAKQMEIKCFMKYPSLLVVYDRVISFFRQSDLLRKLYHTVMN